VHVLAALALMGLGCLWLLMNLSAEFAHARRDARELPGRSPTALTQESIAAIQATPFSATSSKKGRTSPTKATRDQVRVCVYVCVCVCSKQAAGHCMCTRP
jgi:hypothetical protein